MIVVICPGIHPAELTEGFVAALEQAIASPMFDASSTQSDALKAFQLWGLPSDIAPYGPELIRAYVLERWQQAQLLPDHPTVWIGFSAGVVGAVAAARRWQREGGRVDGLIAVDGWGVPLGDRFPRFRLGHDRFTAQSCEWLGASDGYFYCAPAVRHLDLWRSPQQSRGHWQPNLQSSFALDWGGLNSCQSLDAAQLIAQLLRLLAQTGKFPS